MLIEDINKVYQAISSVNEDDFTAKDGFLMNLTLYRMLKSNYLRNDFEEFVLKYDENSGLAWLLKNPKIIEDKPGINISMSDIVDMSYATWNEDWNEIKNHSKLVLSEKKTVAFKEFIEISKESSIDITTFLSQAKVLGFSETIKALIPENVQSILIEEMLNKISMNIPFKETTKTSEIISSVNLNNISEYSLEDLMASKEKFFLKMNKYLIYDNEKYINLKTHPTVKNFEIKSFLINTLQDLNSVNNYLESLNFGSIKENIHSSNIDKGLVYSTKITKDDDIVVIATNGLEVMGLSTLKDFKKRNLEKDPRLHLNFICTQDKFRNEGVATSVFEKIIEIAKKNKCFLSRSIPSTDGKLKTYNKFSKIALQSNVLTIPKKDIMYYEYFMDKVNSKKLSNKIIFEKYNEFVIEKDNKNLSFEEVDNMESIKSISSILNKKRFSKVK
jgi:hypothetical protein